MLGGQSKSSQISNCFSIDNLKRFSIDICTTNVQIIHLEILLTKYYKIHSGHEGIQKKKKVTKDLSMVLKPFGPTDFKMLKQKIGTRHLHEF